MKVFAHLAALSISTLALSATAAGCAADPSAASDVDVAVAGDGNTNEQDLISEHQLVGNELPPHTVALSFDDGPGERTIELTEYLAAQGLPATFFINGMRVPGRQAAIDAVVNRGFLLGNHTQNHLQLTNLGAGQLASEVALTDAIITAAQPDGPFLFRAPRLHDGDIDENRVGVQPTRCGLESFSTLGEQDACVFPEECAQQGGDDRVASVDQKCS